MLVGILVTYYTIAIVAASYLYYSDTVEREKTSSQYPKIKKD